MRLYSIAFGASILALASASVASAQPSPEQSAPARAAGEAQTAASNDGLGEIVVTAQRREQSAQDVPIAVVAFSADQMEKVGLVTTADLGSVIPGLSVNPSAARSPIFLRGVGSNAASTAPSVLMFIDGVYQPFDATGADFSNIRSIEVAKGPQGTLFGRNATGGVIQITTKNPFDWQGLDVEAGYANYDTYSGKLYGAAELSDALAADVAGFYYHQSDGWGHNVLTGADMYTEKRYGVRSKWVAKLADTFTATLVGDYIYRYGQTGSGISLTKDVGFLYRLFGDTIYTFDSIYDVSGDMKGFYLTKESGASLTFDKRFGDVKLLSITSYRHEKENQFFDGDVFDTSARNPRDAFTQEFQLSGSNTNLDWVVGLYYFNLKDKVDSGLSGPGNFLLGLPPGGTFAIFATDKTDAYAAYGQATMQILPATNLTLGARYTIEKRHLSGFNAVVDQAGSLFVIPGSPGTQKATFKKPNFRVAVDHKFTPDVLAYASWSRAFNAGFFNNVSTGGYNELANPRVDPEIIDAYEIGLKSDLLDRRLRVNIAAFQYDYKGLQQQVYAVTGTRTLNAANARIKGIDLDIVARPVRDLTLGVFVNYLDAKYRSYPLAADYDLLPNGSFAAVGSKDAAGKRLVQAPKFGLQATATYTLHTSSGTFDTTANLNYKSKAYIDPQNDFFLSPRTLIGLTEQWTSNDEKTHVTLWAKNLTNVEYNVAAGLLAPIGVNGVPGVPRTYGITIGRKF